MAISKGKEVTGNFVNKYYTGVAGLKIIGLNPNKAQFKELMGIELQEEPMYIKLREDGIKQIYLDFICETIPELSGDISTRFNIRYFLTASPRISVAKGKKQFINLYGDTIWLTKEEFQTKTLPQYAVNNDYQFVEMRECLQGEDDVMNLIKKALNIPNYSYLKADGTRGFNDPVDCEAQFSTEELNNLLNGDFESLRELLVENCKGFKLDFYVRKTDDGKQYQGYFTRYPMHITTKKYTTLIKQIESSVTSGLNGDFGDDTFEFKEYKLTPTTPSATTTTTPSVFDEDEW